MKLKKSPAELKLVRETCDIAAQALKDVIQFARPGMKKEWRNGRKEGRNGRKEGMEDRTGKNEW